MIYSYNLSTQEVVAGGSWVWGQPGLDREFKCILDYAVKVYCQKPIRPLPCTWFPTVDGRAGPEVMRVEETGSSPPLAVAPVGSDPCTSPGQCSRAGSGGVDEGQLTLWLWEQENRLHPWLLAAKGELAREVMESLP